MPWTTALIQTVLREAPPVVHEGRLGALLSPALTILESGGERCAAVIALRRAVDLITA